MSTAPERAKSGSIALVVDERLTRDRRGVLSRVVTLLHHFANIQLINGDLAEEDLLQRLQKEKFSLVLAPWDRYLAWSKIEAFFGLTRSSGPAFAGYFCEPLDLESIAKTASRPRAILLDFFETQPHEAAILVRSLLQEQLRAGLSGLLDPGTPIYCENWQQAQGQGWRADTVLSLPELARHDWGDRSSSVRLLLGALWNLVYEEGPGKREALSQPSPTSKTPRAYLQLGCDAKILAIRLWFARSANAGASGPLGFWPDPARPTSAAQLLRQYSDFVRVHTIADHPDLEVTVGLFKSAPSERAHRRLHSLWIEPLSANLVAEPPYQALGPDSPALKPLPEAPVLEPVRVRGIDTEDKTKDRFLFEAAVKIRELKKQVAERDELIHDLKSGGVGTAAPIPPPDAEGLLEAFQQRYQEASLQIRQFEEQIAELESRGAPPQEAEALRVKMSQLASREQGWIRQLAATMQTYRRRRSV